MNLPALLPRISEIVDDYDVKVAAASEAVALFETTCSAVKMAATIGASYGDRISLGSVSETEIRRSLLKSAWRHVYDGLSIARISTASDRKKFEKAIEDPPPFTIDNIRATFGDYVMNPRANLLRGLAEVFCTLDQAYKSHDKVRIGVKGLPKRVILPNVGGYSWGQERLKDVINALAGFQKKPLVEWAEISAILKDGKPRIKTKPMQWAEKEWFEIFWQYCSEDLYRITVLLPYTGCRVSELLGLDWDNINLEGQWMYIAETKNGESRTVHLPEIAIDALKTVPEADRKGKVFPWSDQRAVNMAIRRTVKALNTAQAERGQKQIPHLSTHKIGSHTYGTWMMRDGGLDLKGLVDTRRWKDLRSAARYAHTSASAASKKSDLLPKITRAKIRATEE